MPFTPVIPGQGLAAWSLLQATQDRQQEVFNRSPDIQRDLDYFTENVGEVKSLDDFMNDRRIQKVVLGAFGLSEEINKGAFVRKVLEEGTDERTSFANRLNNPNYIALSEALPVGEDGSLNFSASTVNQIVEDYRTREYEVAVGTVNDDLRLSLNFEREITELAAENSGGDTGWFKVLASIPLRTVLEGAFNLPSSFSQLDVDRQVEILKDRSNQFLGSDSIDVFSDPENTETTIRRFLLNEQINSGPSASTPGFAALQLLTGAGGLGTAGIFNLLASAN